MGFSTECIHAGNLPDPSTGAVAVPIYQTSTYVQEALGKHKGYEYARTQNPTRHALEENMAVLEKGVGARAFASGMAAATAISTFVKSGDHVVCSNMTYGGTYRYYTQIQARYGVEFSFVDTADPAEVLRAFRPTTRLLHLESPTNPIMTLCDIPLLSGMAHERGAIVVVDNTFASPYLQQPLVLGADIVYHSTTKFLNGHSDSIGGIAVVKSPEHLEWLSFVQNSSGAILGPMDSWLVLRGIKTLVVRMERHESNGRAVAAFLDGQPKIRKVNYPGLATHPQHELAKRQMRGFGAMISFDLGSFENAAAFLGRVRLCSLGESLGGVETLISHPASMTHAAIPEPERSRLGVTPGLVRISVGIEDVEDLTADLAQALEAIPA
ncbi:MAG: PLP-dependent aspartate aminotransferase family protein [Acidobacteria bacterium]|nr:PLP-dependent aspartate aminotransferase family protein [Acidobacteriota bacterium]MCA1611061.1 PLP-dependent aspartate aminotransferase family protein [Acidobacteriota bacterium]